MFVQIARTLNLSKEQRATLFSARAYLHEKFNRRARRAAPSCCETYNSTVST